MYIFHPNIEILHEMQSTKPSFWFLKRPKSFTILQSFLDNLVRYNKKKLRKGSFLYPKNLHLTSTKGVFAPSPAKPLIYGTNEEVGMQSPSLKKMQNNSYVVTFQKLANVQKQLPFIPEQRC